MKEDALHSWCIEKFANTLPEPTEDVKYLRQYVQGMKTIILTLDKQKINKVTTDHLKQIHFYATAVDEHFKILTDTIAYRGEFQENSMIFKITKNNTSQTGLQEAHRHLSVPITLHKTTQPCSAFFKKKYTINLMQLCHLTKRYYPDNLDEEENTQKIRLPSKREIDFKNAYWERNTTPIQDLEKIISSLLASFYLSINRIHLEDDRIKSILLLCKRLVLLHPFRDGNGRVFLFILPFILFKNHTPSLLERTRGHHPLENPNNIALYSLQELMKKIKSHFPVQSQPADLKKNRHQPLCAVM